ncbi:hypothetical protein IU476_08085 [Nocardia blacklockiae]|nr:hypothetical protein [Nocardia blacklockiae]
MAGPDARWLVAGAVGVAVCLALAVGGFAAGLPVLGTVGVAGALLCGARMLFGFGRLGVVAAWDRGARLDLYERGFVVSCRDRVRIFRYDTVVLCRRVVRPTEDCAPEEFCFRCRVSDAAGSPMVLRHGFERPQEWGPRLERGIVEEQLPRARAALAAGERLDFDHFWLTANEIGSGAVAVPWDRVRVLTVAGGWLSVRVAGRAQPLDSLPVSMIPNYAVFRALTAEALDAGTPST